ncbi:MAG TPA: PAS domain S-box protein, partial [Chthonomonadaceae bacterium]|nr:PAS domain S-box protein [Chthonomonadaceae bacterium]
MELQALRRRALSVCIFVGLSLAWFIAMPERYALIGKVGALATFVGTLLASYWCFTGAFGRKRVTPSEAGFEPHSRTWAALCFGLGILGFSVGSLIRAYHVLVLSKSAPLPAGSDVGHLTLYPLLLGGIFLLSQRRLALLRQSRFVLDSLMVLVAAATYAWFFLLGPALLLGGQGVSARLTTAAYPLGDLALLFGLLAIAARPGDTGPRRADTLLALGVGGVIFADVVFHYKLLHGTYANGEFSDIGWSVGCLLIGLAVYMSQLEIPARHRSDASPSLELSPNAAGSAPRLWPSFLPYLLVPTVGILLVSNHYVPGDARLKMGVYLGAALLIAMVLLHQILALIENQNLHQSLQKMYDELVNKQHSIEDYAESLSRNMEALRQAKEEVQEAASSTELLLASITSILICMDEAGRVTRWSEQAEAVFGRSAAEMIDRPFEEWNLAWDADLVWQGMEECRRAGRTVRIDDIAYRNAEGKERLLGISLNPIRSNRTDRWGLLLVGADITERKQTIALKERAVLAALIRDVAIALTQEDVLDHILQRCTEAIVQHLDVAFARIWTYNEAESMLELQASGGMYTHLDGPHSRIPLSQFKLGFIAREQKPHLTNTVIGDPCIANQEWAQHEGMVAFAGFPLIVGQRLTGVMAMFARSTLSQATLEALNTIADGIALGIERKQTEEAIRRSEAQLKGVLNTAADGIVTIDGQGIIQSFNPSAERLFAFPAEEVIGRNISHLMPEPYRSEHSAYLGRHLVAGERRVIGGGREVFGQRKDGSVFPLEISVSRVQQGGDTLFVGIVRDITLRKQNEKALAGAVEELERRNWELVEARDVALSAARAKSEFLANTSHEVRTPLNGVIGMTEVLGYTALDPNQQSYVRIIRQSAEALLGIINDILDFSKVEAGKLSLERIPLSLCDVIEDTAALQAARAHEKGLEVCCLLPPLGTPAGTVAEQLQGDPTRLSQIITNLLSNAIKFTDTGGK